MAIRRSKPRDAVKFDVDTELPRIRKVLEQLGVTYQEFIHDATMQAVDEVESEQREIERRYRERQAIVEAEQ